MPNDFDIPISRHVAINREVLKSMATQIKQWGDVKAVASVLCCHPSTVWRMVKRGQLPEPVKIGNLTRWEMGTLVKEAIKEAA